MEYHQNLNPKNILRKLMSQAGIDNYLQFSHLAQISERHFYRIENGLIRALTLDTLQKIAQPLNLSVTSLISAFAEEFSTDSQTQIERQLKQEYEQLKQDNQQLAAKLTQEWQEATISTLESLVLQLPTIREAVKQNPELPASRLLPLLKPLNQLLSKWEIEPIGSVGEIISYNPQEHELMESGDCDLDHIDQVKIRYVGYRQRDNLLYRAKVSPISQ